MKYKLLTFLILISLLAVNVNAESYVYEQGIYWVEGTIQFWSQNTETTFSFNPNYNSQYILITSEEFNAGITELLANSNVRDCTNSYSNPPVVKKCVTAADIAITDSPYLDFACRARFGNGYIYYPGSWGGSLYSETYQSALYMNGQLKCGKEFPCLENDPEFFPTTDGGKCCVPGITFSAAELDDSGRCCYDGQIIYSDYVSQYGDAVCYQGQFYSLPGQSFSDPYAEESLPVDQIFAGDNPECGLQREGSKFYYDPEDVGRGWLSEGDASEYDCTICGANDWDVVGKCCGDDTVSGYGTYTDTGYVINSNSLLCYDSNWVLQNQANVPFNVLTNDDVYVTRTREGGWFSSYIYNFYPYSSDMVSNGESWHTCDALGYVPDSKEGVQLDDKEFLEVPPSYEFTELVGSQPTLSIDDGSDLIFSDLGRLNPAINDDLSAEDSGLETQTNTITFADVAARFICSKQGMNGEFLECCGDNYESCINKNDKARLRGSFLNTIKEFNLDCNDNYCPYVWGLREDEQRDYYELKIFLNDQTENKNTLLFEADSKLNSWIDYDYLEFYVYAVDDLYMTLFIGSMPKAGGRLDSYTGYNGLFSKSITDYVINGVGLNKWMTVRIPVNEILQTDYLGRLYDNPVNFLEFITLRQNSENFGEGVSLDGINYNNIIAIDKIHLVKEDANYICSGSEYDPGTRDHLWVEELDEDSSACESVPGYSWTGSQCCGDDAFEYYKDGSNYCLNGYQLQPGQAVAEVLGEESEYSDLLYGTNEAFYSCSLRTSFSEGNIDELVTPMDKDCTAIIDGYICSPNEMWSNGLFGLNIIEERDTEKVEFSGVDGTCCAVGQCSKEGRCVDAVESISVEDYEELNLPIYQIDSEVDGIIETNSYACTFDRDGEGVWQDVHLSEKWDETSEAYCAEVGSCWNGEECLFSYNYKEDRYCEEGSWVTRTKVLASKMLEIGVSLSSDDFTLYCDNYENALPHYLYDDVANFINEQSANNYCILKYGENVVLGTSINEDKLDDFLDIVNINNCEYTEEDEEYVSCDANNHLWYNPTYGTVIYSKDQRLYNIDQLQELNFGYLISDPINYAMSVIKNVIRPYTTGIGATIYGEEVLKSARDFDKLFIGKLDEKQITGVIEKPDPENVYLLVDFKNFKTDICRYVKYSNIFCQPVIDSYLPSDYANYKIFSFSEPSFENVWQPATSMLRVEPKYSVASGPSVEIEPFLDFSYSDGQKVILRVLNPDPEVKYYWDVDSDSGYIVNGQYQGAVLDMFAESLFKFMDKGTKKISLIGITKNGKYAIDSVDVIYE